jgi:formate dehydrogenase beta subunit
MIILNSFLMLLGLGLIASIMLAVASKIFYVWEDPRIEQVEAVLLGANCGGCGYAGCSAAAEAVVTGKSEVDVCSAGGFEIAQQVALVMGKKVEEREADISRPGCTYGFQEADLKFTYNGVADCRAAMLLYGGSKECDIGCLGLGTCVRACPFNALAMGENNLPVVNSERCTGCGICVEICPKGIITLSSQTRRIMSDYKVSECTAPCQRNCPAEIDIPEYIRQISKGHYKDAVRVIKEKNPFPLICGWICPAPCELNCRRNLIDEPVGINSLKKFVAEYEKKTEERTLPSYLPPAEGKRIAIIGGGVEGLTAAYYLRCLGHTPKIIEASGKLGGILRYVITEDRLPREVLDWEIEGIINTGVEFETGKAMGKDFDLATLFSGGSDMILLTTGGWDSRQILNLSLEGETLIPGTFLLIDFFLAASGNSKISLQKKVVIVGGGHIVGKAAEACLRNGAEKITVAFPYSEKDAEFKGINLKKSNQIEYLFSATPVELQGDGNRLKSILFSIPGDQTVSVDLDNLLLGSGRYPEMLFEKTRESGWKTVDILKVLPPDSRAGIFFISDIGRPTDFTGVVVAVRRGRKIARAIQLHVNGDEISPENGVIIDEKELQNISEIVNQDQLMSPRRVIDNRVTLSEDGAKYQAARCLECGLICYKKKLDMENENNVSASQ